MFTTLSVLSLVAMAQDPYLNNHTINTSDVFGTARFVGMGGAMGALGADISTISSNPAGLALFSKNSLSLTAGASWLSDKSADATRTFGQFDQIGGVTSFNISNSAIRRLNFGFNYQKKASYDSGFYGETFTSASWADQLDALAEEASEYRQDFYGDPDTYYQTLYAVADATGLFPQYFQGGRRVDIEKSPNDLSSTVQITRGSLNAYDFNLSMNVSDRYFFGLTVGVDNLDYRRVTDYWENRTATNGDIHDFGYVNEQKVTGSGLNLKFGTIIRPFDSSTFRVGFTVETPTWYNLEYVDNQSLTTKYDWTGKFEDPCTYITAPKKYATYYVNELADAYVNFLEYKLTTPWKVRAQMGSTVGTNFAWGVEYEFANYPGTTMKYPAAFGGYNMDDGYIAETRKILKSQHTLRMGVEFKPVKAVALRAGYNFITSTTSRGAEWDPYMTNASLFYPTGLDYMNLSDVHILTLGAGYQYKWFYADLSYKYRHQAGEYYAFNPFYSMVQPDGTLDNSKSMAPIPVNLDRHSIMATIGVRF